jgi:hypothetical protein
MSDGVVTRSLVGLIAKQVEDARLVVWYDPEGTTGPSPPNIVLLPELVPWKEAKNYWDDLMDGKYEWSSIAKQLREKGLVQ